ncbi:hypothetical protein D9M72_451700 [compost metagenome]
MVRSRVGAKRLTTGSSTSAKRSEISCAEDRILRMSWLIFDTARPSSARLFCCFSVFCNSRCMLARCWPATASSSRPSGGTSTRPGSAGSSENSCMLAVIRRIGVISMRLMARKISAAVISEMISDRTKTLRE